MEVKAQRIKIHGLRLQQCLKWNRALNAYIKKNITKKKKNTRKKNITFGYNTLFMHSWWTFELFLLYGYCDQCYCEHSCTSFCVAIIFPLSIGVELLEHVVIPRANLWAVAILFCKVAASFYIPIRSARGFQFLHILANTELSYLRYHLVKWNFVVLMCIFLKIIFSCAQWPFIYFLFFIKFI